MPNNTVSLGNIGLEEDSPRADKLLRAIIGDSTTVQLPEVDESSPNMDKLLYRIYTDGVGGGSTLPADAGVWYNGTIDNPTLQTAPAGEVGDYYLNTNTKKYYIKEATQWKYLGTLEGLPGTPGTKWHRGDKDPNTYTFTSNIGDYYLDYVTTKYYVKETNTWRELGELKGTPGTTGAAGATGAAGPRGPVGPAGPQGPKGDPGVQGPPGPAGPAGRDGAAGAAGPAGAIGPQGPAGKNGATWHVSTTQPEVSTVGEGDYHLNPDTGVISKEVNAQWVVQTGNLKGPKGDRGETGPQGPPGPAGAGGTGQTGTVWKNGNGEPRDLGISGALNDHYINKYNGDIWRNTDGGFGWEQLANTTRIYTFSQGTSYNFGNGWTNAGGNFGNAYYYKKNAMIYLEGAVKWTGGGVPANGSVICTLLNPPKQKVMFTVTTCNQTLGETGYNTGWVSIETNGQVKYRGVADTRSLTVAISLSGISYAI